jgi:surfeit locus 1 family protein
MLRTGLVTDALAAVALAVLLGLGFWQLDRLQWKRELIATIEARANTAAVVLPEAPQEFTRVTASGTFDHGRERHVLAQTHEGAVGVVVVTPLLTDDGRLLLVDRGWVPDAARDMVGRGEGRESLEGLVRLPPRPNSFTPENRPEDDQWFRIDPAAMAGAEALPFYLEASTAEADGWPQPRQRALSLRNDHLQYALTWFALAAGLLVVYVLFRRQAGRAKP